MIANLPEAKLDIAASSVMAKHFRRLKANELVSRGDFTANEHCGFEPWEGPTGFRADAFVKPIYRKCVQGPTKIRKS